MKRYIQKKAFTLLELIFVIIILGIVASVGSTIIAQLYENYIIQRAMHRVSVKTELAINQIVNRLTYRIGTSIIARNPTANTYISLSDVPKNVSNINNTVLEWIGYDNDSFTSNSAPGWSGYCDTLATSSPNIVTPGSNLTFTNTIIDNLSGGSPVLAVLFSLNDQPDDTSTGVFPNADCYGYNGNTNCIHQVSINGGTQLTTNRTATTNISSHYKLAWSAYAIVPVAPVDGTAMTNTHFDLALRYNYQPWSGTQYNSASTKSSTLLTNVTTFKFAEQGGTIRLKLCATEQIGGLETTNISICKEKVVIR